MGKYKTWQRGRIYKDKTEFTSLFIFMAHRVKRIINCFYPSVVSEFLLKLQVGC